MPLVSVTEHNEDTRGRLYLTCIRFCLLIEVLVLGYDPLLSPEYIQSEIPSVSHSAKKKREKLQNSKLQLTHISPNSLVPPSGLAVARPSRSSRSAMTASSSLSAPAPSMTPKPPSNMPLVSRNSLPASPPTSASSCAPTLRSPAQQLAGRA